MPESGYVLLDFGGGKRLEQWGPYRLVRPDPTAIGEQMQPTLWIKADAVYEGEKGKGIWKISTPMPEHWPVIFGDLTLCVRLAPYKHTGVFAEQRQNWDWARAQGRGRDRPMNVLNLFAYTGGATIALAKDGHFVTHIDASKPAIGWAKENALLNNIPSDRIRWILEDAPLFASRERKRGKRYDAIILDPPAFGHSPSGKTWRMERDLGPLLEDCCALLSDEPAFLLLNGYAQQDTPESFRRLLTAIIYSKAVHTEHHIDTGDLLLTAKDGRTLSTGSIARCTFDDRA